MGGTASGGVRTEATRTDQLTASIVTSSMARPKNVSYAVVKAARSDPASTSPAGSLTGISQPWPA